MSVATHVKIYEKMKKYNRWCGSCVSFHQENATTCGDKWQYGPSSQYGNMVYLHIWDCPGGLCLGVREAGCTVRRCGQLKQWVDVACGRCGQPKAGERGVQNPFSLCQTSNFLTFAWWKLYLTNAVPDCRKTTVVREDRRRSHIGYIQEDVAYRHTSQASYMN